MQATTSRRVLIVSKDVIGPQRAGPGIRYLEMARRLAGGHRVTLLAPGSEEDLRAAACGAGFTAERTTAAALRRHLGECEVAVSQGFAYPARRVVCGAPLQVFDLYAPLQLELLHAAVAPPGAGSGGSAGEGGGEATFYRRYVRRRLGLLLGAGDYFLCAAERQRDFWLGALAAAGRLEQREFARDPGLRSLIDCVPFGTPVEPFPGRAAGRAPVLRGVLPGIGTQDFVLLWGGGIWPWLDAETAVRAAALAAARQPEVRLLFLGGGHPNPAVRAGEAAGARAQALAAELGVLERVVFFNRRWTSYAERIGFLAEADAGLLAHRPGIEAHLAFRTRLLDCFWAGLPVAGTGGDELSALVAARGAGRIVPPADPEALSRAILELAQSPELCERAGAAAAALAERFRWDRVFGPLERYLEEPRRAPARPWPRRAAIAAGFGLWVAAAGARHGLWRRAWQRLRRGPEATAGGRG